MRVSLDRSRGREVERQRGREEEVGARARRQPVRSIATIQKVTMNRQDMEFDLIVLSILTDKIRQDREFDLTVLSVLTDKIWNLIS